MESLLITPQESRALIESDSPVRLIDCREADEYAICKIDHAELLPYSTFFHDYSAKLRDKNETILIYCHHGMRSLRAAEYLSQLGYTNVRSIIGGIEAWAREIDPGMPQY